MKFKFIAYVTLPTGEDNVYGIGVGNKKFIQLREFPDISLLGTPLGWP